MPKSRPKKRQKNAVAAPRRKSLPRSCKKTLLHAKSEDGVLDFERFRFFELPLEIRQLTYFHLFECLELNFLIESENSKVKIRRETYRDEPNQNAILLASKQCKAEARLFYYGSSTIFVEYVCNPMPTRDQLVRTGFPFQLITKLCVTDFKYLKCSDEPQMWIDLTKNLKQLTIEGWKSHYQEELYYVDKPYQALFLDTTLSDQAIEDRFRVFRKKHGFEDLVNALAPGANASFLSAVHGYVADLDEVANNFASKDGFNQLSIHRQISYDFITQEFKIGPLIEHEEYFSD